MGEKVGMIRTSTLFRWWIILVILNATGILSAFNISNAFLTYFVDLSPLLMFIIIRFTPSLFVTIKKYATRLDRFIFVYIAFWCIEIVYTLFIYRTQFSIDPILIVRKNIYWLNILMTYPVLYVFEQDGRMEKLLKNIIGVSVLGNLQRFIAWLGYSKGLTIFPSIIKDGLTIRNGSIYRLGGCSLHSLGYDLSIYSYAKGERHNNLYLLIAILFLLYQVVIGQSRAHIICYIVVACYAAYYLLTQKYGIYRRQYKIAMIGIIVIAASYLLFTGYLQSFFGSFSTTAEGYYSGSTTNRLYAMEYYWSLMKSKPWLGLGFIYDDSDTVGIMARYLRGGGIGTAYLEDLGFFGQFFQVGILGTLVLLSIFKRLYVNARNVAKYNSFDGATLSMIFIHIILMCFTTLSIFLKSLFYLVPLYIAISEYLYDKDVTENEIYNCNDGI